MQIKYNIEQVKPNIFAVIITDDYDRAMVFCRAQEFYESPNEDFRTKNFSIWDYIKWYSLQNCDAFTYAQDWSGFNIPFDVLTSCYDGLAHLETPYDKVMLEIIQEINSVKTDGKAYVLGIAQKDSTFRHELCHALWSTCDEYRVKAQEILDCIDAEHIMIFEKNLIDMGYTESVFRDEIQAYLTTTPGIYSFHAGISAEDCQVYHNEFDKTLSHFLD